MSIGPLMRLRRISAAVAILASCAHGAARAEGVTAYLPLNLEPEIEREIERVLILADEPILKRPFSVELVQLALPEACRVDEPLCKRVRRYLERYSRDYGITHASATAALTHETKRDDVIVPNEYGMPVSSGWEISAAGYVEPNDYVLATVGVVGYSGRTEATGSMLSLGTHWAQLDVGYRDHWLSPLTDSSMLISSEAPTTPSVTLSNYEPLTRLGVQYEFFLTELSEQPILYDHKEGTGKPHLFGTQLSIEPFPGWSLGVNRLLEFGGADHLPDSAHFVLRDFFKPSGLSQTQGNQQASYVSRFIFPGKMPFAVYFQYAGEDNSDGGSYLLGNAAMLAGIDFPRIGRYFDATYEIAEWQNIWYVHNIFLDGMTNDAVVLGSWGADQRLFGDGVGARTQMLRVGWFPEFGGYLEERVRTLVNQDYYGGDSRSYSSANPPAFPYHHYRDLTIRYSRPWAGLTLGAEAFVGRDIFGKSFERLSAFVRYGGDERTRDDGAFDDSPVAEPHALGAEWFVDAGVEASRLHTDVEPGLPVTVSNWSPGPHLGIGARRAVSDNNDLGVRAEFDEALHHAVVGLRAVDWRYRITQDAAAGLFAGVERYNLATPAYSIYFGAGATWRNLMPDWDLNVDFKHGQDLARDHVLASDPQGVRPENLYKIDTAVLYLSRRF
jgi:hypothetical protein